MLNKFDLGWVKLGKTMLFVARCTDAVDSATFVGYPREKSTTLAEGPDGESKQESMHRVGR